MKDIGEFVDMSKIANNWSMNVELLPLLQRMQILE